MIYKNNINYMRDWELIFKSLANINRLKIIEILSSNTGGMTVTDLTEKLKISFRATSRHLIQLKNVKVLDCEGKDGHVRYFLNKDIPNDFKKVLKQFL